VPEEERKFEVVATGQSPRPATHTHVGWVGQDLVSLFVMETGLRKVDPKETTEGVAVYMTAGSVQLFRKEVDELFRKTEMFSTVEEGDGDTVWTPHPHVHFTAVRAMSGAVRGIADYDLVYLAFANPNPFAAGAAGAVLRVPAVAEMSLAIKPFVGWYRRLIEALEKGP
jgi:hypothetical protein